MAVIFPLTGTSSLTAALLLTDLRRMRDVIGLEIGGGTAQIMKSLVAREIIGKAARRYWADISRRGNGGAFR